MTNEKNREKINEEIQERKERYPNSRFIQNSKEHENWHEIKMLEDNDYAVAYKRDDYKIVF